MLPQISMQRSTSHGILQALLGTEGEEAVLSQASCAFALLRTSLALGLYGPPSSVLLRSPCAATCLKHASELDILGRTKALVPRVITLDMKHDQE